MEQQEITTQSNPLTTLPPEELRHGRLVIRIPKAELSPFCGVCVCECVACVGGCFPCVQSA